MIIIHVPYHRFEIVPILCFISMFSLKEYVLSVWNAYHIFAKHYIISKISTVIINDKFRGKKMLIRERLSAFCVT